MELTQNDQDFLQLYTKEVRERLLNLAEQGFRPKRTHLSNGRAIISQKEVEFAFHLQNASFLEWNALTPEEQQEAKELGMVGLTYFSITAKEGGLVRGGMETWDDPLRFVEWAEEQILMREVDKIGRKNPPTSG